MQRCLLVHAQLSVVRSREVSTRERLVLYCSNGKYGWCSDSCPLLGRCPLLGMSIVCYMSPCMSLCNWHLLSMCCFKLIVHNMTQVIARPHDTTWFHAKTYQHSNITLHGISSYCDKSYDLAQNLKSLFWETIAWHSNVLRCITEPCDNLCHIMY